MSEQTIRIRRELIIGDRTTIEEIEVPYSGNLEHKMESVKAVMDVLTRKNDEEQ